MELISIGMPAYNGEIFLQEAIQSLLSQTYKEFELIISDDTSKDKTKQICQQFTSKDRRIRYFRQKKSLGVAENFNFTLRKARGAYFMWAGQDDLWDKKYIETLLTLLETYPDAVSAVSNYQNLFESKRYSLTSHTFDMKCIDTFHTLLHFIKTNNLSYFYGLHKTDLLKKIGGYQMDSRPFFKSSDYLTVFKICSSGPMVFTKKTLFFKRDTGLFTQRFHVLEQGSFDKKVRSHILRYLTFPISFSYDLLLSLRYAAALSFSNIQKLILYFHILAFYLKRNITFIASILKGLWYFGKGSKLKIQ